MKKIISSLGVLLCASSFLLTSCEKEKPVEPDIPSEPNINGLVLEVKNDDDLKVAQWTDLHYGDPNKPYHNGKEELTKKYLNYYYDNGKPDFIVASGDNILSTGVNGLNKFIELMDSFKTPWTFVFGNHDAEDKTQKKQLSQILEDHSLNSDYLLYESGFVDEDASHYGNFSIKIKEENSNKISGAFIFLDTGVYNYSTNKYETLTPSQVSWYKEEIDDLQKYYMGDGVIPTVIFEHMQTAEFYDAYVKAKEGAENISFVIEEDLTAGEVEEIKNGASTEKTGLIDAIKEKQSTKAIFVGHAHNYGFQVDYDGVILGFAPQTGHSNTFAKDNDPRRSYLYTFDQNMNFTTTSIKEPLIKLGATSTNIKVGETFETSIELLNTSGKLQFEVSTEKIVKIYEDETNNNTLLLEGLNPGKVTINIIGPDSTSASIEVVVESLTKYNLYDNSGKLIDTYNSFFEALDELFVSGNMNGSIKEVVKEVEGNVVYSGTNNFSYSWFDEFGLSSAFDDGNKIKNGQFSWFSQYEAALKIHTQNKASMMFQTSGNKKNIGKFFARPADFETTNTDGSGGYNMPSGDPNGTWNGWRASVYKASVTTAQYLSWADNVGGYNRLNAIYDLTNSYLYPSKNSKQPVRGEIWLGTQNNAPLAEGTNIGPVIMGISFDGGTVESTKNLADGTKREIRLFSEVIATNSGLTEAYMGTREYGEVVGYALWDKQIGAWKFDSKINMVLDFITEDTSKFKLTVNEKVMIFDFNYKVNYNGNMRLTYGVSMTPDTDAFSRLVPDLRNGSKWTNIVQETVTKGYQDKAETVALDFLAGRKTNGACQVGIYGSDVLTANLNKNNDCVFNFKY